MNTEDSVPNEKKVVYDIHFYAYTPDEKGKVKIILDVEAQKKISHRTRFCDKGVLLYFPHNIRTAWKRVCFNPQPVSLRRLIAEQNPAVLTSCQ